MYLVCVYLQFCPSGKDIRDKTYEQVANIFANVAPLQKISIDFMRLKLRQNGSLVQASVLQYSADIAKITTIIFLIFLKLIIKNSPEIKKNF